MQIVAADELASYVGAETGRSEWYAIDQDRIDAFAETTEDRQWIHIDQEAAAAGPFGTTIAHGFLTLSLVSYLTAQTYVMPEAAMYINYGSDKVRFLAPVPSGSRIRAISTLSDVREKSPGQILLTYNVVIEIEGQETPALVADLLVLAILPPQA